MYDGRNLLYGQHVRIAQCPLAAFGPRASLERVLEKRESASLPLRLLLAVIIATIAFQIPVFKTKPHFM